MSKISTKNNFMKINIPIAFSFFVFVNKQLPIVCDEKLFAETDLPCWIQEYMSWIYIFNRSLSISCIVFVDKQLSRGCDEKSFAELDLDLITDNKYHKLRKSYYNYNI